MELRKVENGKSKVENGSRMGGRKMKGINRKGERKQSKLHSAASK
jgi:hypothetical protein